MIASAEGSASCTPAPSQKLGTGALVENVDSTVGLAVDPDGNVYFGSLTVAPLRVSLRKWTAADGSVTNLGTVVDTSSGGVRLGWGFESRHRDPLTWRVSCSLSRGAGDET